MSYRILSIFHPNNEISQLFQNRGFLNADIEKPNQNYIGLYPIPKFHYCIDKIHNQETKLDISYNKSSIYHQYEAFPFLYRIGVENSDLKVSKFKLGVDYISDDCFAADKSITTIEGETTSDKKNDMIMVSRTIMYNYFKFGYQFKYYPYSGFSISNMRLQTPPFIVFYKNKPIGTGSLNKWQYRGEIRNIEGIFFSNFSYVFNNSILYQPEDWLILHLGLSYFGYRTDLLMGCSVNLPYGANISYQYQDQQSIFDLYIKQVGICYKINHRNNANYIGIKYSLQY